LTLRDTGDPSLGKRGESLRGERESVEPPEAEKGVEGRGSAVLSGVDMRWRTLQWDVVELLSAAEAGLDGLWRNECMRTGTVRDKDGY
jgi:hypothetical protein